jgi:hypothetical protein
VTFSYHQAPNGKVKRDSGKGTLASSDGGWQVGKPTGKSDGI